MKAISGVLLSVAIIGMIGCGDKRAFRPVEINSCDLSVAQTLDLISSGNKSMALSIKDIKDNTSVISGLNLFWKMKAAAKPGEQAVAEALIVDMLIKNSAGDAVVQFETSAVNVKDGEVMVLKALKGENIATATALTDADISDINSNIGVVATNIIGCESTAIAATVKSSGVSTYQFKQELAGSVVSYKMVRSSEKEAMSITQAMAKSSSVSASETPIVPPIVVEDSKKLTGNVIGADNADGANQQLTPIIPTVVEDSSAELTGEDLIPVLNTEGQQGSDDKEQNNEENEEEAK